MAEKPKDSPTPSAAKKQGAGKQEESKPEGDWTKGLKKLYDSVVDEPLPDTFKDLLSKLDSED